MNETPLTHVDCPACRARILLEPVFERARGDEPALVTYRPMTMTHEVAIEQLHDRVQPLVYVTRCGVRR